MPAKDNYTGLDEFSISAPQLLTSLAILREFYKKKHGQNSKFEFTISDSGKASITLEELDGEELHTKVFIEPQLQAILSHKSGISEQDISGLELELNLLGFNFYEILLIARSQLANNYGAKVEYAWQMLMAIARLLPISPYNDSSYLFTLYSPDISKTSDYRSGIVLNFYEHPVVSFYETADPTPEELEIICNAAIKLFELRMDPNEKLLNIFFDLLQRTGREYLDTNHQWTKQMLSKFEPNKVKDFPILANKIIDAVDSGKVSRDDVTFLADWANATQVLDSLLAEPSAPFLYNRSIHAKLAIRIAAHYSDQVTETHKEKILRMSHLCCYEGSQITRKDKLYFKTDYKYAEQVRMYDMLVVLRDKMPEVFLCLMLKDSYIARGFFGNKYRQELHTYAVANNLEDTFLRHSAHSSGCMPCFYLWSLRGNKWQDLQYLQGGAEIESSSNTAHKLVVKG